LQSIKFICCGTIQDFKPQQLLLILSFLLCACGCRPPNPTLSSRTPAEQSAVEFYPALFLDATAAHKMPAVNMGSSIVTAMPVMVNQVR
jgi:hypothetical protein